MSPGVDTAQTMMHYNRVKQEPPRLNNRPQTGVLIAYKNNDLILVHHSYLPPFKNVSY